MFHPEAFARSSFIAFNLLMTTAPAGPKNQDRSGDRSDPEKIRRARGRPSLTQAAELREAFLEAAIQSFLDNGYSATSIEEIARQSGVAKITIYRQFANKQSLFGAAIHRLLNQAREGMNAAHESGKANTRERLLKIIEGMYMRAVEPRTLGLMRLAIAEAARFPELSELVYAETVKTLDPLVRFLKEADRTGKLYVPHPARAAMQISALSIGDLRFLLSGPLDGAMERRAWTEGVLDLVLKGLSPARHLAHL